MRGLVARARLTLMPAAAVVLLSPALGYGSAPTVLPSGSVEDRWTAEDGLPPSQLTSLAIGPHGALWVGTFAGLVRFDGASFRTYDRQDRPELPSDRIVELAAEGDTLWIITESGHLVSLTEGLFSERAPGTRGLGPRRFAYADAALFELSPDGVARLEGADRVVLKEGGPPARSLIEADGAPPAEHDRRAVWRYAGGTDWVRQAPPDGVKTGGSLVAAPDGAILLNSDRGAWALRQGTWSRLTPRSGSALKDWWGVQAAPGHGPALCSPDGYVWLDPQAATWPVPTQVVHCAIDERPAALAQGFWFPGERIHRGADPVRLDPAHDARTVGAVLQAPDGALWMTQGADLVRHRTPLAAAAAVRTEAGRPQIHGLLPDLEAGMWAGSESGLALLHGAGEHLATAGRHPDDGWMRRRVTPLMLEDDGALWVGRNPLCRLDAEGCSPARESPLTAAGDQVWALLQEPDGTDDHVYYLSNQLSGRRVRIHRAAGGRRAGDRAGRSAGLHGLRPGPRQRADARHPVR